MKQNVPVTKPVQSKTKLAGSSVTAFQSQHFRQADTNLANPRTSAWFMKFLRRDALLGGAELNR
eukprot:1142087-Pelagomonas_calceolata.AAC.12